MENYKIRVENEAESKDAQELFGSLGLTMNGWSAFAFPKYIANFVDGEFSDYSIYDSGLSGWKEITLPQLRDLVVLKRNDATDCTHWHATGQANLPYLFAMDGWYFFGRNGWEKSTHTHEFYNRLKPIEKPVKEWLNTKTYEYKKAVDMGGHGKWIEIPEGADICANHENGKLYFWKNDGVTHWVGELNKFSGNNQKYTTLKEFLNEWPNSKVVWSRHTHPEELPFVDDEPSLNDQYAEIERVRQSDKVLKEILEGDLPEFDFEAIDAFIESNIEQGQKHSHYKKDVSHLNVIDIYRVTEMFKPHSCGAHIAKKALCSGQRGHKDLLTDIQDIIDTAERWKEMLIEDEKSSVTIEW